MKKSFFAFGLLAVSFAAHSQPNLVVRAMNCGTNTPNLERDLTTGAEQAGVSGTQEFLDKLAQQWIQTGKFESLSGKTAVVLKPYSVLSKIGTKNNLCVIYEGTVIQSKTIAE